MTRKKFTAKSTELNETEEMKKKKVNKFQQKKKK